jgi:alpha/beta superfamily hydrolase
VVVAGQYLERPALIPVGDAGELTLEGLYHRGHRRPSLLVCPDPGPGGGMDAPPVAELAWACARVGHASLRFQHRGRGASQGEPDPTRALEDALAALQHLRETARGRIAVAGVGAGALTALALARLHPEISRVVLVAPEGIPACDGIEAAVLALVPELGGAAPGELSAALGSSGRSEVIAGADARFLAGLPAVGKRAVEWIEGG